jgi:hypothetical protein
MKYTVLFLLLWFATYTHAGERNDLRLLGLKGLVKQIRESKQTFLYDSNGTDILAADETTTLFNTKGQITEQQYHEEHDEDSFRTIYIYNIDPINTESGETRLKETILLDSDNRVHNKTTYALDKEGIFIGTDTVQYSTGTYSESCDGERNIQWSASIKYLHQKKYDSSGRLQQETYKEEDGKTATQIKYVYDGKGRLLEERQKGSHAPAPPYTGKPPYFVNRFRYRAESDEPYAIAHYSEGKYSGSDHFYYRYDKMGNWIYRKTVSSGKIIHITTRSILYFATR